MLKWVAAIAGGLFMYGTIWAAEPVKIAPDQTG
jgi:hypothetical protein